MFIESGQHQLLPVIVTPPSTKTPLLTADEMKDHLRVDGDSDAAFIQQLVFLVTSMLDGPNGLLGIELLTQTWKIQWDTFPWRVRGSPRDDFQTFPNQSSLLMRFPLFPVQSVVITYYDTNNVLQTLSSSLYGLYTDKRGAFAQPNQGQTWPTVYSSRPDAVTATLVCGYGTDVNSVPFPIRHAAKMLITNWYENRSAVGTTTAEVDALLNLYKRNWVH